MRNWLRDQRLGVFLVIGGSVLVALLLIFSKKEVKKAEPQLRSTLVETFPARHSDEQIVFQAYGTVQPNRQLTLRPEVGGKVVERSPNLVLGGMVQKGEVLVRIDPRNYETAAADAKAAFEKAKFALQQEKGRQMVAEREWDLLEPSVASSEIGKELALRKPHIREKKAAVAAAKKHLEKAQLDLERTEIRAPFDALVMGDVIELDELATPQNIIANLAAANEYRVQVSLPYTQLQWLDLPMSDGRDSRVTVMQELERGNVLKWKANLLRLLGDVDPKSRMARVLVGVKDPMGLESQNRSSPLLIGTYVKVEIAGPKVKNVVVLPRNAIHNGDEVWVKNLEDRLEIRKIQVLFKDEDRVFVNEGVTEGDQIVNSNISIPIAGMRLQEI